MSVYVDVFHMYIGAQNGQQRMLDLKETPCMGGGDTARFQSSDQPQTTFKYLFSQRNPLLSKEEKLKWPTRAMLVKLKLARVPSGSPQVEVTGGCELPNMGAGSQIWILQKSSMYD